MLRPAPAGRAHDKLLNRHGDEADRIGCDALLKTPYLRSVLLSFVAYRIEIEVYQTDLVDCRAELETEDVAEKLNRGEAPEIPVALCQFLGQCSTGRNITPGVG